MKNMKCNEPPQSKPFGIFSVDLFLSGGSFERKFIKTSGLIPKISSIEFFQPPQSGGVLNQTFESKLCGAVTKKVLSKSCEFDILCLQ
jgi:hypothetical protein